MEGFVKLFLLLSAFSFALISSQAAHAKSFKCSDTDEDGTETWTFDSTQPLFRIDVVLSDGRAADMEMIDNRQVCLERMEDINCQFSESTNSGVYHYKADCTGRGQATFEVTLNPDGTGKVSCNSAFDPHDVQEFGGCH